MRRDPRGFTLSELLIVLAVIGILAGIVVFTVGNMVTNPTHSCNTKTAVPGLDGKTVPVSRNRLPDGSCSQYRP